MEIAMGTVILFVSVNFIGVVYSCLVLYTGLFKKFRIQKKAYPKGVLWKRLPLYLLNVFLIIGLTTVSLFILGDFFDSEVPSFWVFGGQLLFIFLIDDAWFYLAHRWMHKNKWALKNIHSIHHRATMPFPLEYLYVHPAEWMLGMVGIVIGVGLIFIVMPVNVYVFWALGFLRNIHEIHIHSDLNIPALNWLPFVASTNNHDLHHAKLSGNYASTFYIWDKLLNTDFKEVNEN
jgi:sterol desaturase/sphingolipid hydroxylase (fatty acid hydroxylase superfamily)